MLPYYTMSQSEESNYKIIQIAMGSRLDHVPAPDTQELVSHRCMECKQETVTEIAYPEDTAIVCNVCAPAVSERLAKEYDAPKVLDMPPEAKARMIEIAQQRRGIPVETLIKQFYAWKTGSTTDAKVVNLLEKKKVKR